MKSRRLAAGTILLTALLVALFNSSVSSCEPADTGRCEKVGGQIRLSWMGGGGKGNATTILQSNQATLAANLLEFANVNLQRGWGDADADVSAMQLRRNLFAHAPQVPSFARMTEAELKNAEAKIYERYPEDRLIRQRRLDTIAAETQRRAVARLAALKVQTTARTATQLTAFKAPSASNKSVAPAQAIVPAMAMPSGDSPGSARTPNGDWEYLGPQQSRWYVIDSLQRLYIWVDTGGQHGVELAIYAPGTTDFWGTRPIGMGSKNRNEGHDLFWTGRVPDGGTWYARVTNHTDVSMPVSVNFERVKSRLKDFCTSCHGNEFDFETCESKDPKFCDEFLPGLLKQ